MRKNALRVLLLYPCYARVVCSCDKLKLILSIYLSQNQELTCTQTNYGLYFVHWPSNCKNIALLKMFAGYSFFRPSWINDKYEASSYPQPIPPTVFELLKIGWFQFPSPLAKIAFKCPTQVPDFDFTKIYCFTIFNWRILVWSTNLKNFSSLILAFGAAVGFFTSKRQFKVWKMNDTRRVMDAFSNWMRYLRLNYI